MGRHAYIHIVRIQGVGVVVSSVAKQVSYYYASGLARPGYFDSSYISGLAEVPEGAGARWEILRNTITVGGFRFALRPDLAADPIDWMLVSPKPITELREPVDQTETGWVHALWNDRTTPPMAADRLLYVDRETVHITNAPAGSATLTVVRGQCGSDAEHHDNGGGPLVGTFYAGSDVYLSPPALTGRLVEWYQVPVDATSSAQEELIARGYLDGEPATGIHEIGFAALDRLDGTLSEPIPYGAILASGGSNEPPVWANIGILPDRPHNRWPPTPIGSSTGGYWYFPSVGAVYRGLWTDPGFPPDPPTNSGWRIDFARPVWLEDGPPDWAGYDWSSVLECYQIMWSDADQGADYVPFGRDPGTGFIPEDNPVTIAANLYLSKDGSNFGGSDAQRYDRGAHQSPLNGSDQAGGLFPLYSLGVSHTLFDKPAWERAREETAGVRARRLFLGGRRLESLRSVGLRLLSVLGYAMGAKRDGAITLLRLGDVYPAELVTVIDGRHLLEPSQWRQQILARSLDRIVIDTEPGPDGGGEWPVTLKEVTRRRFYPLHVGELEQFEDSPYSAAEWGPRSPATHFATNRVRRLSGRAWLGTVLIAAELMTQLDVGSKVELRDPALRRPETGLRWLTGAGIKGVVVGRNPDWRRRRMRLEILAADSPDRLANYPPRAKLNGGAQSTAVYTVHSHRYTRPGELEDSFTFDVGDVVVLCDRHLVLRSDPSLNVTVLSRTATTITTSARFTGAQPLVGADGDVIMPSDYDRSAAPQRARYAYGADGGDNGSVAPALGAADDAPYQWGD